MSAGVMDFCIEQGATFRYPIIFTNKEGVPLNLKGCTAKAKIRVDANSLVDLASFDIEFEEGGLTGVMWVSLSATITATLPTTGKRYNNMTRYSYDIKLYDSLGEVHRVLNGNVYVSPEVSD